MRWKRKWRRSIKIWRSRNTEWQLQPKNCSKQCYNFKSRWKWVGFLLEHCPWSVHTWPTQTLAKKDIHLQTKMVQKRKKYEKVTFYFITFCADFICVLLMAAWSKTYFAQIAEQVFCWGVCWMKSVCSICRLQMLIRHKRKTSIFVIND